MKVATIVANLENSIRDGVAAALHEDLGAGDLTAELVAPNVLANATIVAKENAVVCGQPWFNEVFAQLHPDIQVNWLLADGDVAQAGDTVCTLHGPSREILSGERTALNFLQTLSGTATATARYVRAMDSAHCKLLDTRKTLPGLRLAQKYAVRCGGGRNHRIGLFDAILIKENHIQSCGGISTAVSSCRQRHPEVSIEIEVETIEQLREALASGVDRVLLDNFSADLLREAVAANASAGSARAELEASGSITEDNLAAVAATGVDFVSIGAITKHVRAIDFSMRFS